MIFLTIMSLFLGSQHRIAKFGEFSKKINVKYLIDSSRTITDTRGIQDRTTQTNMQSESEVYRPVLGEGGKIVSDFGTVVRIVHNGKLIILFNGTYGAGILGAISATTNKEKFMKTNFDQKAAAQELLVKIENMTGNNNLNLPKSISLAPDFPRGWFSLSLDSSAIAQAIESTSEPR